MLPVAILAGGLATRIRPITETIPKALIKINEEPFLAHQLRLLQRQGISRAVLCLGYRASQIRDFAGDGSRFGVRIEYAYDGPTLLGTAGALRAASPLLGEAFFVLYGDSYLPCDFGSVESAFSNSGKQGLMTVFRNEGQWDKSNVEFADGSIVIYDKQVQMPSMHHIDYGLGVFRASVFESLPENEPADLARIYQDLLRRGQLAAVEIRERFYEVGSFEGIRELEEFLSS